MSAREPWKSTSIGRSLFFRCVKFRFIGFGTGFFCSLFFFYTELLTRQSSVQGSYRTADVFFSCILMMIFIFFEIFLVVGGRRRSITSLFMDRPMGGSCVRPIELLDSFTT